MKIIEREYNALTGKETVIEREETAQEQELRKSYEAELAANEAALKSKAIAKAALLKKLGITEAEAELLLA